MYVPTLTKKKKKIKNNPKPNKLPSQNPNTYAAGLHAIF